MGTFEPDPMDNFPSPFTLCRTFSPSTYNIKRSAVNVQKNRLGSRPLVVGLLGSEVRISASFQIFALAAVGDFLSEKEIVRGEYIWVEMSYRLTLSNEGGATRR